MFTEKINFGDINTVSWENAFDLLLNACESLKKNEVDRILCIFLALFTLNTVGNIFAKTNFEKTLAGLTLIFAILIWKI